MDLTYGCIAEGEYKLISEEKVDQFTLKQYTVDPAYDVIIGYSIAYKDESKGWLQDGSKYWHTIRSELSMNEVDDFQIQMMEGDEHTAEPVDIPGMDKAVFVTRGINQTLIAIRKLDTPVTVKTPPNINLGNDKTKYQYELIQLEGFTLGECISFFRAEERN